MKAKSYSLYRENREYKEKDEEGPESVNMVNCR